MSTALRVYIVASHIYLLPSLVFTLKRFKHLWIDFFIVLQILFWSFSYHLCFQFNHCLLNKSEIKLYDAFFSLLAIPLLITYILKIRNTILKGSFYIISANANIVQLSLSNNELIGQIIYLSLNIFFGFLIFGITRKLEPKKWKSIGIILFIIAIMFTGTAIYFFVKNTPTYSEYLFAHAIWHSGIFPSLYFMFKTEYPSKIDLELMEKIKRKDKDISTFIVNEYILWFTEKNRKARQQREKENNSFAIILKSQNIKDTEISQNVTSSINDEKNKNYNNKDDNNNDDGELMSFDE